MAEFEPAAESFPRILNRHGLEMFVKVFLVPEPRGNCYMAHGLGNVHDAANLRAMTRAFVDAGYNVIVWDATHSSGRSEGTTERARFYNYYEDMEDVMEWSKQQAWYRPSYVLAGHSLGGMVVGSYAAAHPVQVEGVVLVVPVVSGRTLRRRLPLPFRAWWRVRGLVRPKLLGQKPYSWEFMRSGWSYNLLAEAPRLSMRVLMVGAGRDVLIPPRLLRRLFRAIRHNKKRLIIVAGAHHGFDQKWEMERLQGAVSEWLEAQT